ncbi:hypothetical protein EDF52_1212 [Curtobacterium sp. PhB42]|nr:hypothetical protein EDF52_1212 [Curtobacterium sp. PhB42]
MRTLLAEVVVHVEVTSARTVTLEVRKEKRSQELIVVDRAVPALVSLLATPSMTVVNRSGATPS